MSHCQNRMVCCRHLNYRFMPVPLNAHYAVRAFVRNARWEHISKLYDRSYSFRITE